MIEFFGEKLRKIRKELHISQKELSSLIGVTQATISLWETSERSPNGDNIIEICSALDLPISTFIDVNPDLTYLERFHVKGTTKENLGNNPVISDSEQSLIFDYRCLNDNGRKEALKRIHELTELKKYTIFYFDNGESIDLKEGIPENNDDSK